MNSPVLGSYTGVVPVPLTFAILFMCPCSAVGSSTSTIWFLGPVLGRRYRPSLVIGICSFPDPPFLRFAVRFAVRFGFRFAVRFVLLVEQPDFVVRFGFLFVLRPPIERARGLFFL